MKNYNKKNTLIGIPVPTPLSASLVRGFDKLVPWLTKTDTNVIYLRTVYTNSPFVANCGLRGMLLVCKKNSQQLKETQPKQAQNQLSKN